MTASLVIDGVTASYDGRTPVLREVTFSAERGEAIAVIGPSGAGKSTLFRGLARLSVPDAGRVSLGGIDMYARSSRRALRGRIGFIHQRHALPAGVSCLMAVLGGQMHDWNTGKLIVTSITGPNREEAARAGAMLERVGLAGREHDRVSELSLGQQQRVAIARTLLQQPDLIVADEPVASVDPVTADLILDLLIEQAHSGAIVVCSLHDPARARAYFPRIIGIDGGYVAFDCPADQLTDEAVARLYATEAA
jgi:phosphonate transport system ATP-binding protein